MKVFGAAPAGSVTTTASVTGTPTVTGGTPSEIAAARDLYAKAIAAQQAGDWAGYGTYIKQLGAILEKLATPSKASTTTK
jgi:uncharacterized membrane protein (UPF0182 family)